MWISHDEYKDSIHKSWLLDPAKPAMTVWNSNLTRCRKALKGWSKDKFLNPNNQVNGLLANIDKFFQSNQPDAVRQINSLTSQITKLWTQDQIYWHQRSRVKWLRLGDWNTSFFHHTTLQRRQFNKILKLQDDNGQRLNSNKDISKYF